jgi:hypothetical protein
LFKDHSHRPRQVKKHTAAAVKQLDLPLNGLLIVAAAEIRNGSVLMALSDGNAAWFQYLLTPEFRTFFVRRPETIELTKDIVFVGRSPRIIGFSRERNSLTVIEEGRGCGNYLLHAASDALCCFGSDIVFCPDDASLALFSPASCVRKLCPARSRVVRLCADKVFRVVIAATAEGFLRFFDANGGEMVREVDVGGEVELILVTPKWGLVVVCVKGEIVLFNVNGLLLKRRQMGDQITAAFAFASQKDFDYVAFVTERNRVGLFEALHPEKSWVFHDGKEPIVAVLFERPTASFIVLSQSGHVTFLPHSPLVR